jgi:hypothetical protein
MAKINGGIIGPNNPTGPFTAGGVWRLEDAFNAQKAGEWPVVLGYQIPNSLRFNSGSSDHLNRTFSTDGTNNKIQTLSCWVKRSNLGTDQVIMGGTDSVEANQIRLLFLSGDTLNMRLGGASANDNTTTAVFRDVSAWYHIVVAIDTTQATAANRVKIYINGTQQTIASPSSTQDQISQFVNGSSGNAIGAYGDSSAGAYFNGYISEFYFIDGQALTPSSFGQTDSATGIWTPIAYTGTYGTNGFYLKFANSAALGTDSSGNGNTWTANNLTSIDQSYDSPTNNFATLNPIAAQAGSGVSSAVNTFTEGNLKVADLASDTAISNFGVSTGKWFWEVQVVTDQDGIAIGACNDGFNLNAELGYESPTSQANGKVFGYYGSGSKFTTIGDGTQFSAYGSAIAVNDIIGVALDLVNNQVTFYKNGTSQGTFSITALGSGESYFPAIGNWSASAVVANYNFGYPPFTISSGNADANGFGNFEYAVPSGYYALCTKNLALYG